MARLLLLATMVCGCGRPQECVVMPGSTQRLALTGLTMPVAGGQFALDLDGDGRPDNALVDVIRTMLDVGMDPQGNADLAFAEGREQLVLDLTSRDPAQRNAGGAGAVLSELSGGMPGAFCGVLIGGGFSSLLVPHRPVDMTIPLAFVADIRVPLVAAELQIWLGTDGRALGQVNGAIRVEDLNRIVPPAIASLLMEKIRNEPNTPTSNTILSFFDNGGGQSSSDCQSACKNPVPPDGNGLCAVSRDGVIDTCEVSTNSLVEDVLRPDVDLFDSAGLYAPSPNGKTPDAFSFGVEFDAIVVN